MSARSLAALALAVLVSTACALAGEHDSPTTAPATTGQVLLDKVRSLAGTWDAPTSDGTMTDIFRPFANGTAVLGEEWMNGKQITSTVFYVVKGQLYADHYCDYQNQPRYTAVPSADSAVLDFEFRDATNLDNHPAHFHTTRWKIGDATHLIQDWYVMGGKKPVSQVHMEFVKRSENSST